MEEDSEGENGYIYAPCMVCDNADSEYGWKKLPRKFLICAGNTHAICCGCGYRIKIPKEMKNDIE